MAEIVKPIKVGKYWTNLVDTVTGENVNFEETLTWYDGTPMDDSKADGVIYRKLPASVGGGYVKRVYKDGIISVKWFGAVGDGVVDDTEAIQSAFDFLYDSCELVFPEGTYNFTSQLVLNNKTNITITGKNAILFDGGQPLLDVSLNEVMSPVGIIISNVDNLKLTGLRLNGNANPVGVNLDEASQPARVPQIEMEQVTNFVVSGVTTLGYVGPKTTRIYGDERDIYWWGKASYFMFNGCRNGIVEDCEIAPGSGRGEIFTFYECDGITWRNCRHIQGDEQYTFWSLGKLVKNSNFVIYGHQIQSTSAGDMIDWGGNGLIVRDLTVDYPNGQLLDLTSEHYGIVNSNITISDCVTTGGGVISGLTTDPQIDTSFVKINNVRTHVGSAPSEYRPAHFIRGMRDVMATNLDYLNFPVPFGFGITVDGIRNFYHRLSVSNFRYVTDESMAGLDCSIEANGLTEIHNGYINTNGLNTLTFRDRWAEFNDTPLPDSHSKIAIYDSTIENTTVLIGCNTEFVRCKFYNCRFETYTQASANDKYNASISFRDCDFEFIDTADSITASGGIFVFQTLSSIYFEGCRLHGATSNSTGRSLFTELNAVSSPASYTLINTTIDISRTGSSAGYPGVFRISNDSPSVSEIIMDRVTVSEEFNRVFGFFGDSAGAITDPVSIVASNLRYLSTSLTHSLIANVSGNTSVDNIDIDVSDSYAQTATKLTVDDFNSLRLLIDYEANTTPTTAQCYGSVGSTYRVSNAPSTSQVLYLKTTDITSTTWDRVISGASAATETETGVVELATQSEANAGTDTGRVITPATLEGKLDNRVATVSETGLVNQSAAAPDTAVPISAAFDQAEVQAILDELRDLKGKMRTAGLLAT